MIKDFFENHSIAATNGTTTRSTFTIPQERGRLIGFSVSADNATVADQVSVFISVDMNGDQVLDEVNLADLNQSFLLEKIWIPAQNKPGGTVGIAVKNDLGSTVNLRFTFNMQDQVERVY